MQNARQTRAIASHRRQPAIRSQHRLLSRNPRQLDTLRRPSTGARPLDGRLPRQCKNRSDDLQRGAHANPPSAPAITLASHCIKTQGHLAGPKVEIWEFDLEKHSGQRVL
jgi:hypothetical protein